MKPSPEIIQKYFGYDPVRGVLLRKIKLKSNLPDEVALDKRVSVLGVRWPYSHIIWVVHYGKWPEAEIDHKNHNQLDFKIDNLREATRVENGRNRRSFNAIAKGVTYDGSVPRNKPWLSRISVDGKSIFLGSFATSEEAHEAYREACLKYHGEFACLE